MKKQLLFLLLLTFSTFLLSQKITSNNEAFFYENKGQIIDQNGKENPALKYLYHSGGLNVQLKSDGFSYDVYEVKKTLKKKNNQQQSILSKAKKSPDYDLEQQFHRVDIDFINANKNPTIITEGKSSDYDNYYNLPNNPKGVENVHRYQKLIYKELYPNIDLVFFKPEDTLKPIEYNFIVNPGGKISDIKLQFKGAKTKLKDGKLSMNLRFGEMQENIPHSWEEVGTGKNTIEVKFKDLGKGIFGFNAEKDISDKVVVIDPVPTRIWGSYFGGNGDEYGELKADRFDNVFLHGYTSSTNNVATTGTYQPDIAGSYDTFVNKISKNGQKIWGTYYGGLYDDFSGGLDFDQNDNIFVVSDIHIPDPANPGNPYYYFGQAAILKFNPDGTLIYEKIFGGNRDEITYDLRFYNDKIYIIGETYSNLNLATPGAFQENLPFVGQQAGFVGKFNASNGNTEWITYVTGNAATITGKIFNTDNGIEIIATTRATDFPMINAFQPTSHIAAGSANNNGLYLRFSENGSLLQSSYVGENDSYNFESARRFGDEIFFGAHVYSKKHASFFIANLTNNTVIERNIPVINSLQTSTYIDVNRNLFVANFSCPEDVGRNEIATPNAFMQNSGPGCGSHFMKFDENLNKIWGTFYPGHTQLPRINKDRSNNIYIWGLNFGYTPGMTTPGTFQQTVNSTTDEMFIAKFADCESQVTVTFSPTCINQNLQLNASGGSTYKWSGPNGFTSTLQNPVINNAQATDSGEYFVRIMGGQSCGGIFSIMVNIGSPTLPVLDIPNLPNITAFCSVTITTIPTATTGCGTTIYATTSDPLSYNSPGNYVIVWKYDDGIGNTLTQNQNVIVQGIALPTANLIQNFCKISSPKISDLQITGTAVKWYDATGVLLDENTLLIDGTKYFATQTLNSCESAKLEISVIVNDPSPPTGNVLQDFCSAQNPTLSNMVVTGQNIKWFDAAGIRLATTTLLQDGLTYFATQTLNGCESTQKLAVTVNVTNGGIPANDYSIAICNDTTSNTKTDNLNNYKGNLITNPTSYIFDFYDANNQLISDPANVDLNIGSNLFNVKISNSLGCFNFVKLTLTLNPKPILNLRSSVEFCNGQTETLDAGAGFSSYEWTKDNSPTVISTKQLLVVSEPGKYSVKVKNKFDCENTASVNVTQSVLATITGIQIINNTATVQMSNTGDYEYSLDNLIWQNSNVFKNLSNGSYTVFVKTKLGCIIGSMNFSIFSIPDNFSPNADGKNDTWKISGLENYPGSEIQVFDRFGNQVLQRITNGIFEWDGFSNSRVLSTGNYWYVIKVSDGRLLNGWVLLKNRN